MIKFLEKNKKLTRKERERLLKRFEILDAAVNLFATKGYDGTKLEDIAEAAEFGKGTLYNYFQSKEDIYVEIIDIILKDYTKRLEKMNAKSKTLFQFITLITNNLIEFILKEQSTFLMLLRLRVELNAIEKINKSEVLQNYIVVSRRIFKEKVNFAIKKNEIKKIDSEYFALFFRNLLFPYFNEVLNKSRNNKLEKNLKDAGDFAISTLFNGISKK